MLDGEVVLREVVEVERAAEGIGRGEEASAADGDGEVWTHVEAFAETFDEVGDRHVAAVVVDEAVVCEG